MNETLEDDIRFMRQAIEIGRDGQREAGCAPIGCVIVLDGKVIASGHNEVGPRCDATAHAEIVTIRRAAALLAKPTMRGATLYSTLQPCGMCSMATIWSHVSRVVFGAARSQVHSMYFEDRHIDTLDIIRDAYRNDMRIEGGVLGDECAELYYGPHDDPPNDEQTNIWDLYSSLGELGGRDEVSGFCHRHPGAWRQKMRGGLRLEPEDMISYQKRLAERD